MTEIELIKNRAVRNTNLLNLRTKNKDRRDLFVSYYIENNQVRFTIRLNEVDNRIYDIDFALMLYMIKELSRREDKHEKMALIEWPDIRGLNAIYARFSYLSELKMFDNERSNVVLESIFAWYDQITRILGITK